MGKISHSRWFGRVESSHNAQLLQLSTRHLISVGLVFYFVHLLGCENVVSW